jgi:hypothetical protein
MTDKYEILIEGHLNPRWSDWLGGLTIAHLENGVTLLSGAVPDPAALHDLMTKVGDLNLKIISIEKTG